MPEQTCDICGVYVGSSYDVHAALIHPDTRPAILAMREHRLREMSMDKKAKRKKKAKEREQEQEHPAYED
jgi:hypothetical protein